MTIRMSMTHMNWEVLNTDRYTATALVTYQ